MAILDDWLEEASENRRFYERLKDPEHMQAGLDFLDNANS